MRYRKRSVHQDKDEYQIPLLGSIPILIFFMYNMALCCGIIFIDSITDEKKVERCTLETTAYCTQVQVEKHETFKNEWKTLYYPVFRYTVDGNTYEGRSATGKDTYVEGKHYKIYVDPDAPSEFVTLQTRQKNRSDKWIIGGIGVILELIFTSIIISHVRRDRRQKAARELKELSNSGTDNNYIDFR